MNRYWIGAEQSPGQGVVNVRGSREEYTIEELWTIGLIAFTTFGFVAHMVVMQLLQPFLAGRRAKQQHSGTTDGVYVLFHKQQLNNNQSCFAKLVDAYAVRHLIPSWSIRRMALCRMMPAPRLECGRVWRYNVVTECTLPHIMCFELCLTL